MFSCKDLTDSEERMIAKDGQGNYEQQRISNSSKGVDPVTCNFKSLLP